MSNNYITPKQMQRLDNCAREKYGIPSIVLMENAGRVSADAAMSLLPARRGGKIACVCGKGNNGGDGFVCARYLINRGIKTDIFLIGSPGDLKGDARVNYRILQKMANFIHRLDVLQDLKSFSKHIQGCDIVIDAIFGIGLRGEVKEPYVSIINCINKSERPVLSIDVPSGLDALTGLVLGACIKADKTVTFAFPKIGFVKNKACLYTGDVIVKDISIPGELLKSFSKNKCG